MSGSSNNGGIPSINRPNDNENCNEIVINTHLSSPKAEIINELSIGDILSIAAVSAHGPIQVFNQEGKLAGNILSREMVRLLKCIIEGVEYEAEVTAIENGMCQVQIYSI